MQIGIILTLASHNSFAHNPRAIDITLPTSPSPTPLARIKTQQMILNMVCSSDIEYMNYRTALLFVLKTKIYGTTSNITLIKIYINMAMPTLVKIIPVAM
ncbi:hypothetical protein Tsp_07570 [Trichinella spiralis]|uniref:hypothetical protein n=1 Tax=Trichinella spiralis TaxID=6334 RepID=UPI0001EFB5C3|nr:hypothetical protein Tsp_07570 [Trichinella spiralis]